MSPGLHSFYIQISLYFVAFCSNGVAISVKRCKRSTLLVIFREFRRERIQMQLHHILRNCKNWYHQVSHILKYASDKQ